MRNLIIAAACLAVATPAFAQPADDDWLEDAPPVERVDVDHYANTLERLVGAIMDIPVGGIAAAVDPLGRGGVYPDDTIGDLARRNDPDAEARIHRNIRATSRGVHAMSRSMQRMMPALRHSYEQIRETMRVAIDQARDDYDDGYED